MKTKTQPQGTMTAENENEVLFETKRTDTDVIRISKRGYKGKSYIDMRIFFLTPEEELRPTKKGFTISEEIFSMFAEGVSEVNEMLSQA